LIRRTLRLFVRLAVSTALTGYLLWKSHPRAVLAAAAGADWRLIGVAVVLVLADRAFMAYHWVVLLWTMDPVDRPPLAAVIRIFLVSTFVGTFLPASVGGDAVRAYAIAKLNVPGGDAVASVFMDRMLGVASLLVMALGGMLVLRDLADNPTIVAALGLATTACAVTLLLIFSGRTASAASRLLMKLPGALRRAGEPVLVSIRRYARYHRQLANVLACSIAVQTLRIIQAYYLGRGLGVEASVGVYFAFVPLILLVMLLPVTFNGIGTSQAAFVWFFARAGVRAAASVAVSVLFVSLEVVGNLPVGLLWAADRRGHGRQRPRLP